jgi:tripartite-type tricarboxylate transporter receptor subunit TctC
VIGGQVPLFFGNLASTLQHVQAGRLRALAVTSTRRSSILPDVPSLTEAGLKGAEIYEWNAVFAPAGTPDTVIQKLSAAFQKSLESPDVRARVLQLGGEIQKLTPDQSTSFIQQQINQWSRVIKERGIVTE